MADWQDIKTAPRDRPIDLWQASTFSDGRLTEICRVADCRWMKTDEGEGWARPDSVWDWALIESEWNGGKAVVTHWTEIPEGPRPVDGRG